jgi:hypothetical protein
MAHLKSMSLVGAKLNRQILSKLKEGKTADDVYEEICCSQHLHNAKNHGIGTTLEKRKTEHIWRTIMFMVYDFLDLTQFTQEQRNQAYSYITSPTVEEKEMMESAFEQNNNHE